MATERLVNRRSFLATAVAGLSITAIASSAQEFSFNSSIKVKAIAFDAFTIFDPRPLFSLAQTLIPEKGLELSNIWRAKQFEYSWLRTAAGRYKNFWDITDDALVFAAKKMDVTLTAGIKSQLLEKYLTLDLWPDVLPALEALKERDIRLTFLSNMTNEMLNSCIKNSKIESYFESVISTDNAKTYKPNPKAYQLGIDTLKLKKSEILFAAFAGWDASGSKWFGYPTFWVNRVAAPSEELDTVPDGVGKSLNDLVAFITS